MRVLIYALMLTMSCIALLLAADGEGKKDKDKGVVDEKCVCPIYRTFSVAQDYCNFYAFECPTKPVPYYAKCDTMTPGSCDDCCTDPKCAKIQTLRKGGNGYADDKAKKGLTKKLPKRFLPKKEPKEDVNFSDIEFVDIATPKGLPAKTIKAKIFLVTTSRPKMAKLVFGHGVEIDTQDAGTAIPFDPAKVRFEGKICDMDYKGNNYIVIMNSTVP